MDSRPLDHQGNPSASFFWQTFSSTHLSANILIYWCVHFPTRLSLCKSHVTSLMLTSLPLTQAVTCPQLTFEWMTKWCIICAQTSSQNPWNWEWVWASSRSWWWTGKPDVLHAVHGVAKSQIWLSDWTELRTIITSQFIIACEQNETLKQHGWTDPSIWWSWMAFCSEKYALALN